MHALALRSAPTMRDPSESEICLDGTGVSTRTADPLRQ
jgi:hypothetical protein